MAEGNLLSLSWNNHLSNWKYTLSHVIQKDTFSDVTIVCEGRFYSVHKIVLASCSEYFSAVLEKTPCRHPFIILKDISTKDIGSLIAYMYRGEVSVNQSDVPSLIRAAETLGIKGLATSDDPIPPPEPQSEGQPKPRNKKRRSSSVTDSQCEGLATKQIKREEDPPLPIDSLPVIDADDIKELECAKKVMEASSSTDEEVPIFSSSPSTDFLGIGQQEVKRENTPFNDRSPPAGDKNSPCGDLRQDYIINDWLGFNRGSVSATIQEQEQQLDDIYFEDMNDRQDHIPFLSPGHPCTLCPKLFQSRADVVRHMRTHTGEKPFKCPHCEYRAALKGNLKSHILSQHSATCV